MIAAFEFGVESALMCRRPVRCNSAHTGKSAGAAPALTWKFDPSAAPFTVFDTSATRLWHCGTVVVQHIPVCRECPCRMLYATRLPVCSCAPAVVLRSWCAATVIGASATALAAALDARVNASNVRLAGRYQRSRLGRHKHAQRMRRWRDRRSAHANKVTHQGSHGTGANDVLAASQTTEPLCTSLPTSLSVLLLMPVAARAVLTLAPWRCRFCGARVPPQLRPGFLRPGRGSEP